MRGARQRPASYCGSRLATSSSLRVSASSMTRSAGCAAATAPAPRARAGRDAANRSSPSATTNANRPLPAWWRRKTSRMLRSSVAEPSTVPGPISSSSCASSCSRVSQLGLSQVIDRSFELRAAAGAISVVLPTPAGPLRNSDWTLLAEQLLELQQRVPHRMRREHGPRGIRRQTGWLRACIVRGTKGPSPPAMFLLGRIPKIPGVT